MNILDVFIVIIIGFFILHSFFRGFIKEAFALLALIISLIIASNYYLVGAAFLAKWGWISNPFAKILGYLLIFAIFSIGIILIGRLVQKLIGKLKLSWLDRLGGSVFGILKGLLIVCVIVLFLTLLLPAKSPLLRESKFTPYILSVVRTVSTLIPSGYKDLFKKKERRLRKWKNSILSIANDEAILEKEGKASKNSKKNDGWEVRMRY